MNDPRNVPTLTEIVEGPVSVIDRLYAFDQVRDLCRIAPRAVRRARTLLEAPADVSAAWPASAEGALMLDGGLIVASAVTAATMREAIDLLVARFRHRLHRLEETRRDQPIGSFPANAA
jgi:ribosome-associated translation inhibitor RaiA